VLLYSTALDVPFLWDDSCLIERNEHIQDLRRLPMAFRTHFFDARADGMNPKHGGYYRPLVIASFAIEYQVLGPNPVFSHLTNTAIHLANTLLVYSLCLGLLGGIPTALAAAALFAAHPVHTAAVTYISGRPGLMVSLLFLGCLRLYVRSHGGTPSSGTRLAYWCALLAFALALLAKETAVTLPVVLLLYEVCFRDIARSWRRARGAVLRIVPFVAILLAYLLVRAQVLNLEAQRMLAFRPGLSGRVFAAAQSVVSYLGLLCVPANLRLERFLRLTSPSLSWPVLCHAGVLLCVGAGGLVAFFRSRRAFFAICWFLVVLLPMSNIVPIYTALVDRFVFTAEHFLYVPSVGAFMLVAMLLRRLPDGVRRALLACILACLAALAIDRNQDWEDAHKLWKQSFRGSPWSWRINHDLGVIYSRKGRPRSAIRHFRTVAEMKPTDESPHVSLARLYAGLGNDKLAMEEHQAALRINPNAVDSLCELGLLHLRRDELELAKSYCRRAVATNPTSVRALLGLGMVHLTGGEYGPAEEVILRAVAQEPDNAMAHCHLGIARLKARKYDGAIVSLQRALALDPSFAIARRKLAEAYEARRNAE